MDALAYHDLGNRLGQASLSIRLKRQAERTASGLSERQRPLQISSGALKQSLIIYGLRAVRLYERGYNNYRDIQIREHHVALGEASPALIGLRILHISDLHIDLDPTLTDVVIERLSDIDYDLCVITGDFRSDTFGPSERAIAETKRLADQIDAPIYATLGNHDFIEIVPPLERIGVQFLLNESTVIERDGQSLYLSGIDDSHTYKTDDLPQASRNVPTGAPSILLSHTPDVYADAARHQYDLMLCGHTHAGQICLPGGIALQKNTSVPRRMMQGRWQYGGMVGYTSSGTGATGVPIRFFCPPEITVHILTGPIESGGDFGAEAVGR
jgi:predicted MPP superfamily phosphohydrolase